MLVAGMAGVEAVAAVGVDHQGAHAHDGGGLAGQVAVENGGGEGVDGGEGRAGAGEGREQQPGGRHRFHVWALQRDSDGKAGKTGATVF